jgi:hypothetical protein
MKSDILQFTSSKKIAEEYRIKEIPIETSLFHCIDIFCLFRRMMTLSEYGYGV